jgi:sialidase-1
MMARVSYDEGKTWPISRLVYEGGSAYSDLAVVPDMTIACLYEVDKYAKIVLARFNIEWLTEGSDSLEAR